MKVTEIPHAGVNKNSNNNNNNSDNNQGNVDVAEKGKPYKTECECLVVAAQNNAIRTNNIKVRIEKKQKISRCRLCGDRDETIKHISVYSKLVLK